MKGIDLSEYEISSKKSDQKKGDPRTINIKIEKSTQQHYQTEWEKQQYKTEWEKVGWKKTISELCVSKKYKKFIEASGSKIE